MLSVSTVLLSVGLAIASFVHSFIQTKAIECLICERHVVGVGWHEAGSMHEDGDHRVYV